ncbi:MAG: ArsR/SmtB family transcription factor [Caulobacteraceae bacterium]
MNLEDLEVGIFKALAHPIRLKIIKKLRERVYCVCEMNEDVEFSQSNLSQHLKILRDAGIVYCEKEGMRINYYVKDPKILEVVDTVEGMVMSHIRSLNAKLEG